MLAIDCSVASVPSVLPRFPNRYFATFDGTDDYVSIPAATAAGDFEISVQFSTTELNANLVLTAEAVGFSNYIAVRESTSALTMRIAGGTILTFTIPIPIHCHCCVYPDIAAADS